MSTSFANQVLARSALWIETKQYKTGEVYVLPKKLDEKVARLHLARLGVKLEKLTADQAEYLVVDPEGPYKPDAYRCELGRPDAGMDSRQRLIVRAGRAAPLPKAAVHRGRRSR
jgi:hypothetical protein